MIDSRRECQLHRPLHAAGHFLNPEFLYDNPQLEQCEEVVRGLYQCFQILVPIIEKQDKITNEITAYKVLMVYLEILWLLSIERPKPQNADECRRLLKEENGKPELEGERPHKSLHDFADISYLARLQTVRTESMP